MMARRLLLGPLLLALVAGSPVLGAGCNKREAASTGPELLFSPSPNVQKTFETTIVSSGYALQEGKRQPFESTLAMRLTQRIYPPEPDGRRLLRLTASDVSLLAGDIPAETTRTFSHEARVLPDGLAEPMMRQSSTGRMRPVGRQPTIESIYDYVQPVYSKGRPTVESSWATTFTAPVPPGADMPFRFRYRATGRESRGGRDLLRIETSFSTSGTAEFQQHYITTIVIGTVRGRGTTWVDPEDLQAVEASVTWTSKIKRHVAGVEGASFTRIFSTSGLTWREVVTPARDAL